MLSIKSFDLTNYNSYKIKSICKIAYFPDCEEDFIEIYKNHPAEEVIIIGGGYNIILSKSFYDKVFVIVGDSFSQMQMRSSSTIFCESGVSTKSFSEFALANNLTGAEIFYDIPSSIGGAVVMNAGASGEEIKDILIKVRYLDLSDMIIKEINQKEIGFEYRNSFFQKNTDKVVLKAWFQLHKGNPANIRQKMDEIQKTRWSKQPKDLPNAGSVFKRPQGFYVGAIIDELELKGFRIGGAEISKKHGGFIVNIDKATGSDILAIIEEVQKRVLKRFKFELEIEQRII